MSALEDNVLWHIANLTNLPAPEREYKLPGDTHPFDIAWPDKKLLIEVQGGIWTQGAHTRGKGAIRDHDKANYAAAHGWRVMYVSVDFINDPSSRLLRIVEAYNYGNND